MIRPRRIARKGRELAFWRAVWFQLENLLVWEAQGGGGVPKCPYLYGSIGLNLIFWGRFAHFCALFSRSKGGFRCWPS